MVFFLSSSRRGLRGTRFSPGSLVQVQTNISKVSRYIDEHIWIYMGLQLCHAINKFSFRSLKVHTLGSIFAISTDVRLDIVLFLFVAHFVCVSELLSPRVVPRCLLRSRDLDVRHRGRALENGQKLVRGYTIWEFTYNSKISYLFGTDLS